MARHGSCEKPAGLPGWPATTLGVLPSASFSGRVPITRSEIGRGPAFHEYLIDTTIRRQAGKPRRVGLSDPMTTLGQPDRPSGSGYRLPQTMGESCHDLLSEPCLLQQAGYSSCSLPRTWRGWFGISAKEIRNRQTSSAGGSRIIALRTLASVSTRSAGFFIAPAQAGFLAPAPSCLLGYSFAENHGVAPRG